MKTRYSKWTLINWDSNPALKLQCWRKSFRHGHVSVGVGDFNLICYSYGANSDDSISGTRWRVNGAPISETQAMAEIDDRQGLIA